MKAFRYPGQSDGCCDGKLKGPILSVFAAENIFIESYQVPGFVGDVACGDHIIPSSSHTYHESSGARSLVNPEALRMVALRRHTHDRAQLLLLTGLDPYCGC